MAGVRRSVPFLVLLALSLPGSAARRPAYPAAPRGDVVDDFHGTKVPDPYRWLEDLRSGRTAAWVQAENRLTADAIRQTGRREGIRRRLASLWDYARTGVPWREAGRLFYLWNTGRQPQPALYAEDGPGVPPRLVLDPASISADGSVAVREHVVSPDGRLLAYLTSRGGADVGEVHVREVATGRSLPDVVPRVLTSVCWTHDARGFFYVRSPARAAGGDEDAPSLAKQVLHHTLGRQGADDRLVREYPDARWVYCMTSDDGRRAFFVAEKGARNEIDALDLGDPDRPDVTAPPVRLLASRTSFDTPVDVVGNTFYVRTTESAPRQRVIALDLREGARARPRTIVPEMSDVILDAVIAGDRLVLHTLADVKSRLRLYTLDGEPAGEISLPGIGAVGWPLGGRPSSSDLYYSFTSFLVPSTIYRYDMRRGTSVPFRAPRVPFDQGAWETRQIFFASKDGTRVPMFVTAAKGLERDGTHPTLLTGYGGYGMSRTPAFEPDIPLWLEMGGVWAVANIRGGGEYGEDWHRAGMLERKQNGFDDFIAAAEHLVAEGFTVPGRLAVSGHSNGGLLVGAVLTQRPDLFAAAVANAGHYDMLRYHRFTAGAGWVTEYGSPDDAEAFRYLLAYSPLHRVRPGTCYPATLLLAADHDDRVVPSHAYKFAAALQAAQACDRPILLRVATDASHSYASRDAQIAERADLWAFLASRLGVSSRGGGRAGPHGAGDP